MKKLVVYYSRTGTTRKVAEEIAKSTKCDIDEITDNIKRAGPIGYIRCGKEAMKKSLPKINTNKDPRGYDLVMIGTPIWGWNMASPVRSYISKNKFKEVAFFATQGGSGAKKAFKEMSEITGKNPKKTLILKTEEVAKNEFVDKVKDFTKDL